MRNRSVSDVTGDVLSVKTMEELRAGLDDIQPGMNYKITYQSHGKDVTLRGTAM